MDLWSFNFYSSWPSFCGGKVRSPKNYLWSKLESDQVWKLNCHFLDLVNGEIKSQCVSILVLQRHYRFVKITSFSVLDTCGTIRAHCKKISNARKIKCNIKNWGLQIIIPLSERKVSIEKTATSKFTWEPDSLLALNHFVMVKSSWQFILGKTTGFEVLLNFPCKFLLKIKPFLYKIIFLVDAKLLFMWGNDEALALYWMLRTSSLSEINLALELHQISSIMFMNTFHISVEWLA